MKGYYSRLLCLIPSSLWISGVRFVLLRWDGSTKTCSPVNTARPIKPASDKLTAFKPKVSTWERGAVAWSGP